MSDRPSSPQAENRAASAESDYGIVVGIERYPALGDVPGVASRARAFQDWLLSSRGGALPSSHVQAYVLTEQLDAEIGTPAEVVGAIAFVRIVHQLVESAWQRADGRVGRRLYLYFSGRAIVMSGDDLVLLGPESTALRGALSTRQWLDWLRGTALFDEVVLVADVEEERRPASGLEAHVGAPAKRRRRSLATGTPPARTLLLPPSPPPTALRRTPPDSGVRILAALSTSPRLSSGAPLKTDLEQQLHAGDHSLAQGSLGYTGALLDALAASPRDGSGRVTGQTLVAYLQTQRREPSRDDAMPRLRVYTEGDIVFREQWDDTSEVTEREPHATVPPTTGAQSQTAPAQAEAPPGMANAYALLVGISDYANLPPLASAAADARALAALLVDRASGGYAPDRVRVLVDREATRASIIQALRTLATECDEHATILVYFAGHGRRWGDAQALLLVLADATNPDGSYVEDPATMGIPARELQPLLDAIPARRIALVLDCAHAGAARQPRAGRSTIAACMAGEGVHEGGTVGGEFTRQLLNALRGGAAGGDPYITVFDLFEYAQAAVAREGQQHPTVLLGEDASDFPVALRPVMPLLPSMQDADGFRYDVYVQFVPHGKHSDWVWRVLLPRLTQAGLRVAVSEPVKIGAVSQVVTLERGVLFARRTLVLLTQEYLAAAGGVELGVLARLERTADPQRFVTAKLERFDGPASGRRRRIRSLDLVAQTGRPEPELGVLLELLGSPHKAEPTHEELWSEGAGAASSAAPERAPDPPRLFDYACLLSYAAGRGGTLQDRFIKSFARELEQRLGHLRPEPLWCEHEQLTVVNRDDRLHAALQRSACVVIVCTPAYFRSEGRRRFLHRSLAVDKERRDAIKGAGITQRPIATLIPVVLRAPELLPPELRERQYIDMSDWGPIKGTPSFTRRHLTEIDQLVELINSQCSALEALARTHAERRDEPAAGASSVAKPTINASDAKTAPPISVPDALERITFGYGDLLLAQVDAIVSPVGMRPSTIGLVGRQLLRRVGKNVMNALYRHGGLATGETIITGAGSLPAQHVIHTCTESEPDRHTPASVALGAVGAINAAERLGHVRTIAMPALGTGAADVPVHEAVTAVMEAVVERLARGTTLERVHFAFRDEELQAEYEAAHLRLRERVTWPHASSADAPLLVATHRWFLSARQAGPAPVMVGDAVHVVLAFSTVEEPGAVLLRVPVTALELGVYIDAPAFHVENTQPRTVSVVRGDIGEREVALRLVALAGGVHEVRLAVHPGGGVAGITPADVTCMVEVAAAVGLPDVRELVDRRAIPNPQPAVMLYVALEREDDGAERLRVHVTCPALGLDRWRSDEPLALGASDVGALRHSAAAAAAGADGVPPPDVDAAMRAFGAALFDRLFPAGHALREFLWRALALAAVVHPRPLTWLVVADEGALLPWELVCPHGWDEEHRHWWDDFLARRFVVAHWVGRRGLQLADEAPIGPVGLVHYRQQSDDLAIWRAALGGDERVGIADPELSLDVLGRGSPFFGVHLLRYADPLELGHIIPANVVRPESPGDTGTRDNGPSSAVAPAVASCRLDFTLRRPVVGLSLVDATPERAGSAKDRETRLERAWALPFLDARVTAVIGPRWTTSPEGDRLFFRVFYGAVHDGVPLGRAAWEAREQVRLAFPDRADWLAYAYFGHPDCEPYAVQPAEGFTVFEPLGVAEGEPFESGRTYRFRASYRSEMPAWYGGRLRVRREPLEGAGVTVMVAPLAGGVPTTYTLKPVDGDRARRRDAAGGDWYCIVELTMPPSAGTLPLFVQFMQGARELRSTVVTLDVTESVP